MPSLSNGEAPTCESNDLEASHSIHSQSTAIVGDNATDDDAEFEREMRLMLMGHHPQTIYSRKVFLGGLPSYSNSEELFDFMSLAFGDVIMAQIEVEVETDYPKGAGCVVFRDRDSFLVAIARRFISFKVTDCFKKDGLEDAGVRLTSIQPRRRQARGQIAFRRLLTRHTQDP
ncbi:hypothetical protein TELCIR_17302 [Teladorsagia circumcincta]|uniref:RRM domain-containing protein n=1 Tax=Teladorsagia circumcincta TaxID=45464 RepID=A0A2G9TT46_TELCI|nr:hypothetical protein TELCIR_17302 [Teladorsagia circumcincta]